MIINRYLPTKNCVAYCFSLDEGNVPSPASDRLITSMIVNREMTGFKIVTLTIIDNLATSKQGFTFAPMAIVRFALVCAR